MGRIERKLKKKTRLERQQVYINRLSQFNTNAMHEIGKLAMGLRHYADGSVWGGHECTVQDPKSPEKYLVWKGELDGPELARKVLTSLGLPWDQVPQGDPVQKGRESVLKNLSEEMRKDAEDREPDDRSEYGRYVGDKVVPISEAQQFQDQEAERLREAHTSKQQPGEPPKGVPAASHSRDE